jgi:hypothetical protein
MPAISIFLYLPIAITGSTAIIDDSIQQLESVQQAWDQRWTDIFEGSSGLYLGINQFASVILVGAFLFFAVGWVKAAIERGIFPAFPEVLWVLVVAVLLFNNGGLLGSVTLGLRDLINAQTRTVLDVQVGEVSMVEALNDVILSQQAKALIQQQYAECEAREGQAQIDCFVQAGEQAQQILEAEYRDRGFWTAGIQRLWNRIGEISQAIEQQYQDGTTIPGANPLADILVETLIQTGTQALVAQLLKGW